MKTYTVDEAVEYAVTHSDDEELSENFETGPFLDKNGEPVYLKPEDSLSRLALLMTTNFTKYKQNSL